MISKVFLCYKYWCPVYLGNNSKP